MQRVSSLIAVLGQPTADRGAAVGRKGRAASNDLRTRLRTILVAVTLIIGVGTVTATVGSSPARADTGGYPDATMPCEHSPYASTGTGYWCANYDWGPVHTEAYNDPSEISSRGYAYRNCTDFAAWKIRQVFGKDIRGWGNAEHWETAAVAAGYSLDSTPRIGDIAQWDGEVGGGYGHVAYVYDIVNGVPKLEEYNRHADGNYTNDRTATADHYIHIGDIAPGNSWVGKIVQWYNGPDTPNTSWIVSSDAQRYWIPDGATYYCMTGIGYVDAGVQPSSVLDSLPDSGQWARCPVAPRGAPDSLTTGQGLYQGQTITSADGRYTLILQQDHNLVVYGPSGAVWATNIWTGGYVIMQSDCNVVGYDMWSSPKWATNTGGVGTGCTLVMQDDGNLVVYRGGDGRPVWDRYSGRLV